MFFSTLFDSVLSYDTLAEDLELLKRAYEFARQAHEGQFRRSSEEFIVHPLNVAFILSELRLDIETIAAALLHGIVEDTAITLNCIERKFGKNIASLVDGVTKLGFSPVVKENDQKTENIRKMFFAMVKDVRVVLIKLADCLHDMRTLDALSEAKQIQRADEALKIYAPISDRLGIYKIKWELEDLSLRYLDKAAYYSIGNKISQKRGERELYIDRMIEVVQGQLYKRGINGKLEGRAKHFYSIYTKMRLQKKSIEEIFDLFAIRIIVSAVSDCYVVLGIVHSMYSCIPTRFKDYVSTPKSNKYQSIHTTVLGLAGFPVEIQIRTYAMHHIAENGVASHWKYKETLPDEIVNESLKWMYAMTKKSENIADGHDFIQSMEIAAFNDKVFVFTPKGKMISLSSASTVVDFAYAVRDELGNKMVGAKVNNKNTNLNHVLENGDVVDVITSAFVCGPNLNWLKFVKTVQAYDEIKKCYEDGSHEDVLIRGRKILEFELLKSSIALDFLDLDVVVPIFKENGCSSIVNFYLSVGYGRVDVKKVVNQIEMISSQGGRGSVSLKKNVNLKSDGSGFSQIRVQGYDEEYIVRFSKCCEPVYGEKIIGYSTKKRGVAIHCENCLNVRREDKFKRMVQVSWKEKNPIFKYDVSLKIVANDRRNLLSDMIEIIKHLEISMKILDARIKNNVVLIDLTVEVSDIEHLAHLIYRLKNLSNIIKIYRKGQGK